MRGSQHFVGTVLLEEGAGAALPSRLLEGGAGAALQSRLLDGGAGAALPPMLPPKGELV